MTDLPLAKTRPASNWSAIWVLPLLALAIGGWLGWRAYSQAGIEIQVLFENGSGIQVGKTEVIFKGIAIGKVTELAGKLKSDFAGTHYAQYASLFVAKVAVENGKLDDAALQQQIRQNYRALAQAWLARKG